MSPTRVAEGQPLPGRGIPNYGVGVHRLPESEVLRLDPGGELRDRLLLTFNAPDYKPFVLPKAAIEINRLAAHPSTEIREIIEVLGTDPVLAGQVLAAARSPLHAGRAEIRTLQDAVTRLGMKGLRNLVLQVAATMRVFRGDQFADVMASVKRHSLVVGHFAAVVGRMAGLDPHEAFLAGLLHDVGLAAGLVVIGDRLRTRGMPAARFWPAIVAAHAEAGMGLCRSWGCAEAIALAASGHHAPPEPGRNLTSVVYLAHGLADLFGEELVVPGRPCASKPEIEGGDTRHLGAVRLGLGFDSAAASRLHEQLAALHPVIA